MSQRIKYSKLPPVDESKDAKSLLDLLRALSPDGTVLESSGNSSVVKPSGITVDETIAEIALRQGCLEDKGDYETFSISGTGRKVLASLERGVAALELHGFQPK